jgi:hypothetical protein
MQRNIITITGGQSHETSLEANESSSNNGSYKFAGDLRLRACEVTEAWQCMRLAEECTCGALLAEA